MLNSEKKIDKTIINFYLYKVSKDDNLKKIILEKINNNLFFIDVFINYLKKHYLNDKSVIDFLIENILLNDEIYFDYPKYIVLKNFKDKINFKDEIFNKLYKIEKKWWLLKIEILEWLFIHNKKHKILRLEEEKNNYYLNMKILKLQYEISIDIDDKLELEQNMIKSENYSLNLMGIYLRYMRIRELSLLSFDDIEFSNSYVQGLNNNKIDVSFIVNLLSKIDKFNEVYIFFNEKIFNSKNEFLMLNELFKRILNYKTMNNYKFFIDSLDQFNHILIERVLKIVNEYKNDDYGSKLKSNRYLENNFIKLKPIFNEIHENRNLEFHPKDKDGNFHNSKINYYEQEKKLNDIFSNWLEVLLEILSWFKKINS